MPEERFVLGYWNIRGLGAPIRYALTYLGVSFTEKRYTTKKVDGGFDRSEWLDEKEKLDLDFPNLPYLIDKENGIRLTQSLAIHRYIWEVGTGKPLTTNPVETARLTLIEQEVADALKRFTTVCYSQDYENMKKNYLAGLPNTLKRFEKFLGNNDYLTGSKIYYVDFMFYEFLDIHQTFEPSSLDTYPKLIEFHKRIESLEPISAYIKSDAYIKRPINNINGNFY